MGVGNARVAERSAQLLEVGFLDGVAAGVHGRGGVPGRAGEKAAVRAYGFAQDARHLAGLGTDTSQHWTPSSREGLLGQQSKGTQS